MVKTKRIFEDELVCYIEDSFYTISSVIKKAYWNRGDRYKTNLYKLTINNMLIMFSKINHFEEKWDEF